LCFHHRRTKVPSFVLVATLSFYSNYLPLRDGGELTNNNSNYVKRTAGKGCDEFRRRSDNGDATTKTCNDDEVKVPSLAFYLPFLLAPTPSPQIVFAHAAIRDTRQTQKETGPRRIKRNKKAGETWQKTRFMRQKQRGLLKERPADRIEKFSNSRDVRRLPEDRDSGPIRSGHLDALCQLAN